MWLLQMCSCVHEYLPWPGKAYGVSVVSVALSEQRGTFTLAYIPHWSDFHLLGVNMIWAFDDLNFFFFFTYLNTLSRLYPITGLNVLLDMMIKKTYD